MKNIKMLFVAIATLIAGCATVENENKDLRRGVPEVSSSFRSCYGLAKRPWLVDVVAGESASNEKLNRLISDFVGVKEPDYSIAKKFLSARRSGQYASSEEMAGDLFSTCQADMGSMRIAREKAIRCFWEQKVLLHAMDMRFYGKLSQEQTVERVTAQVGAADEVQKEAIHRLVRDTFIVLKPGGENAFSEAQFQLCMTVYR